MAPQSFDLFPRLPIELRLMIWSIAIEDADNGRIIRVKQQSGGRFQLSAGKTPSWLLLCKESRDAALTMFPYIHANRSARAQEAETLDRIWVNFHVDILYMVDSFRNQQYLDWLQDVARKAKPNHAEAVNVVRHLAFKVRLSYAQQFVGVPGVIMGNTTPLAYKLCASHHSLQTIAFVDDRSKFKTTEHLDQYYFAASPTLARHRERWFIPYAVNQLGKYFSNLGSTRPGMEALEQRTQQQPPFVIPDFPVCGIRKTKRSRQLEAGSNTHQPLLPM